MNAEECAKVIIANLHEEKETGRWFLIYEEIMNIRRWEMDHPGYYNELIDTDDNMFRMAISAYHISLEYIIHTRKINEILKSYLTIRQWKLIMIWINCELCITEKISKNFDTLKATLNEIFQSIAIDACIYSAIHKRCEELKLEYLEPEETKLLDLKWIDMRKIHINDSRSLLVKYLKRVRDLMGSILAYKELIIKWYKKTGDSYYLDKINAIIDSTKLESDILDSNLNILHNWYKDIETGYDGFLKKEMDMEAKATFWKEHEGFLE